ncbi:hypothetical protein BHM03_00001653 [Ensete ventricosum]|nr:hypothetical protein BHM03_00001653 [Ensete ventricosum]
MAADGACIIKYPNKEYQKNDGRRHDRQPMDMYKSHPEAALGRLPPPTLILKIRKALTLKKGTGNTPVYSANLAVGGTSSGGSLSK